MHVITFTLGLLASFTAAVGANPTASSNPTEDSFVERQVSHTNGSTVSVWLRNTPSATPRSPEKRNDFWSHYHRGGQTGRCGHGSTFKATCELAAAVLDCQAIVDLMATDEGWFEFGGWHLRDGDGFHTLVKSGKCAFGASVVDEAYADSATVGSTDVSDLIIHSWKYARDGKVGTYGQADCNSGAILPFGEPIIAWALYEPGE